jgi:hypothetical protein
MATLVKNGVQYFVRNADCLGRSCLDLGKDVEATFDAKGLDIRLRMHSVCRRMSNAGCPAQLPEWNREPADKRKADGVRLGRE